MVLEKKERSGKYTSDALQGEQQEAKEMLSVIPEKQRANQRTCPLQGCTRSSLMIRLKLFQQLLKERMIRLTSVR